VLFADWQSRDIVEALVRNNKPVSYCHLDIGTGHDAFLTHIDDLSRLVGGFLGDRTPKVMKWQERRHAAVLSMVREVVFGVGFALLLPLFFGLDGVLYSMPFSDILTFLIAAFLIKKTYKELGSR
jgi:hypothetical protein